MRGQKQIVCADHLASIFQVGANPGVVNRRFVRKVHHLDVAKEELNGGLVLAASGRNLDSVEKVSFGDNRYANIADRHALQFAKKDRTGPLDNVGAHVCIQHEAGH